MKLEQQVVSLELAKKLKELGVKQESLFAWAPDDYGHNQKVIFLEEERLKGEFFIWNYSAFTVAELGEMLPLEVRDKRGIFIGTLSLALDSIAYTYGVQDGGEEVATYYGKEVCFRADTEADARAEMLIYLLENNLLTQKP